MPAVALDQRAEIAPELVHAAAGLDAAFHGAQQIVEQVGFGSARDDKAPIMRGARDVVVTLGGQIDLPPEKRDLLRERLLELRQETEVNGHRSRPRLRRARADRAR